MNTPARIDFSYRRMALTLGLAFGAAAISATHAGEASDGLISGFEIVEGTAKISVDGEAGKEIDRELTVIDPTGRSWSATVVDTRIELKPGSKSESNAKGSAGSLKLKVGQSYSVTLASATQSEEPEDKKEKAARPAPSYVLVSEGSGTARAAAVARLNSGFASPPKDSRHTVIRTNAQGANFTPPASRQVWESRKSVVRDQLLVTQGLWPMWPKTPLNAQVYGIMDRGDYTIEKVALETVPGFYLSGNVFRPKFAEGKLPAILSPHGHYLDGRMNPDVQARCIRLAKMGFLVFMYDMVGYNDSKAFGHTFTNEKLDKYGLNLVGFQTFNSIRALDWLQSLPEVDAARIGCTGESGGGTQTFFLCAMDDRIAAASPVVMISEGFQGGCTCENASGMRVGTDNVEIGAAFAPRPMRIVGATGDWTANTMTVVLPKLKEVYSLYGRPDLVTGTIFNFEHNYNRVSRNAVYPFFAKWLQNVPDTAALREPELKYETPETLLALTDSKPFEAKMKSREEIEAHLIEMRSKQIEELLTLASRNGPERESATKVLKTALKVRTGVVEPSENELKVDPIGADLFAEGVQMRKSLVGRAGTGEAVPVVELIPNRTTGVSVVISADQGVAGLIGTDGKPVALVQALLARGTTVFAYDPLFVGSSFDPATGNSKRPDTAHFLCYNKSLTQDRLQDLANVVALAKSRPDCRVVHLAGSGSAAEFVLWTRPSLSGIGRTYVELDGASEPLGTQFLAGAAQAGGLTGAAQAISPGILKIERAGSKSIAADIVGQAYKLDGVPGNLSVTDVSKQVSNGETIATWLLDVK
jgi:hypothetical protein